MNCADINIVIDVSLCHDVFSSLGKIPRRGISGSNGISKLGFFEESPS